jgi:hypothetical protein
MIPCRIPVDPLAVEPARRTSCRSARAVRPALCAVLALAVGAGAAAPLQAQETRDYLIGAPTATLTLRGGMSLLRSGSGGFDFLRDQFATGASEFQLMGSANRPAASGSAELAVRISPRTHIMASFGFDRSATRSEFEHFVDQDDLPIEQETRLLRMPIALSVKQYITPPGQSIGRFAWVPNRFAPYVGAGGGAMAHRLEMDGDFIDFKDYAVFSNTYRSNGFAPMLQGFAGLDMSVTPRIAVTAETRYQWAKGELGREFVGFDRIDLSGLQTTIGVQLRL